MSGRPRQALNIVDRPLPKNKLEVRPYAWWGEAHGAAWGRMAGRPRQALNIVDRPLTKNKLDVCVCMAGGTNMCACTVWPELCMAEGHQYQAEGQLGD